MNKIISMVVFQARNVFRLIRVQPSVQPTEQGFHQQSSGVIDPPSRLPQSQFPPELDRQIMALAVEYAQLSQNHPCAEAERFYQNFLEAQASGAHYNKVRGAIFTAVNRQKRANARYEAWARLRNSRKRAS